MPDAPDDAVLVGDRTRDAVRWSAVAVLVKQASQMVGALVLARVLGPDSYGVISIAMVYVTLTTLLLDQGLASALVQRPDLSPRTPGAVTSLNVVSSLVLGAVTYAAAPAVSGFFGVDGLTVLLRVLGAGLLLKGLAITPRAMLMRSMRLKAVALADVAGAVLGAAVAITAAVTGAGTLSLLGQVLVSDVVITVFLLRAGGFARPNLDVAAIRAILPYGLRIFGVSSLAFCSRNADNVLVGRFLGVTSLSYYSMAYRVLVIPVQLLGQTVNRVLFPAFSRIAADRQRLAHQLNQATELLASVAVPLMVLVASASTDAVGVVLGDSWSPTAPVLSVLALAGARETVFYVTGALMRATGAARLNLRYEIVATVAQLGGIVIGLQFGLLGVAVGYAAAGFMLVPALLAIQTHLTGVPWTTQLGVLWRPVHVSAWGSAGYVVVATSVPGDLASLVAGSLAYVAVMAVVAVVVHRTAALRVLGLARSIFGPKKEGRR